MRLEVRFIEAPLRAPFVSASSSLDARRLLHVTVIGDDGVAGHGEAAPLLELDHWLAPYRQFWDRHLDALGAHLDETAVPDRKD